MNELEIIHHRQMEGLSIFFDTVDYRTPHTHSEWELIWVLEQPLAVTCRQEQFLLQPGEMILFNPKQVHEFHKTRENCTFLCIQISPEILPEMLRIQIDGHLPARYLSAKQLDILKGQLCQALGAYLLQREHYALFCTGQICLALHTLFTHMPGHIQTAEEASSIDKRNQRMERLLRFVDDNFSHKICLSDFARAEGCSLSHLSRFIKATLNQSFQEYVTSVRFHNACKLMASSQMRLLDVCMESGFSDYRYFSREFRWQYGMTPEEYRSHTRQQLVSPAVRHSLHSVERFYTRAESLTLMEKYMGDFL